MSDYTLYWEALSGAVAPQAMFEEMNIPYRRSEVDVAAGMLTLWHPDRDAFFARHEKVGELCHALSGRPACARVMNEHAG